MYVLYIGAFVFLFKLLNNKPKMGGQIAKKMERELYFLIE